MDYNLCRIVFKFDNKFKDLQKSLSQRYYRFFDPKEIQTLILSYKKSTIRNDLIFRVIQHSIRVITEYIKSEAEFLDLFRMLGENFIDQMERYSFNSLLHIIILANHLKM